MNQRTVENIKVIIRKSRIVYLVAKAIYSPVALFQYIEKQRRIAQKTEALHDALGRLDLQKSRVYYFGVPIHENLGDAAQMYCIRKWIHDNYPNRELVEIETFPTYKKSIRRRLTEIIGKDDILVCESGATFCNRHEDHGMHRWLLSTFVNNRILFMPQTVDLSDKGEMEITASLFNAHPSAVFIARDPESFRMVSQYFEASRIRLCPDIVTTIIGDTDYVGSRDGVLICKRIDGEKKYSDFEIAILLKSIKAIPTKLDTTDTNFEHSLQYTYSHLEKEIHDKFRLFSRYKVIVTDRYHGMIFALIANTPVVVLSTSGHKVREGALWLKKDYPDSIYFCETPEDAYQTVKEILDKHISVSNKGIYKEKYFDSLLKDLNWL